MQDRTPAASSLLSSGGETTQMQVRVKEGVDSDDELRRVPEFGAENPGGPSTSGREASSVVAAGSSSGHKKRGRNPADKEQKRIKRLLRNRVSAQQARERKKAYMNELEAKVSDIERRNTELEERLSTLQNENQMLRQILKNTTVGRKGPTSTTGSADASV